MLFYETFQDDGFVIGIGCKRQDTRRVAIIAGLNKCESSPKGPFISTVDELTRVSGKLRFMDRDTRLNSDSQGSEGAINRCKFVTALSLFCAFFDRIWSINIQCNYDDSYLHLLH
ncbi:hypothetical protein ACOME3_001385 [Neoechinorhynchus agilis]